MVPPVQGGYLWVVQVISPDDSTFLMVSETSLFPLPVPLPSSALHWRARKLAPNVALVVSFLVSSSHSAKSRSLCFPDLPFWPGLPYLFTCTLPFINSGLFRLPWRQPWWFTYLHGLSPPASHLYPHLFFFFPPMSFIVHLLCAWLWDAVMRQTRPSPSWDLPVSFVPPKREKQCLHPFLHPNA